MEDRIDDMAPMIKIIMWEAIDFFVNRGLKPTITCTATTLEEDEAIGRRSRTHREGRAFDLRTWDLPKDDVQVCMNHLNTLYGHMGAVSFKTKMPRLIVHHNAGTGAHLHVQISPSYLEPRKTV